MTPGRHTVTLILVASAAFMIGLVHADEEAGQALRRRVMRTFTGLVAADDAAVVTLPDRTQHQAALNAIFTSDLLAQNVRAVRRRATAMSPQQRLKFLTDWVLPGDGDPAFRLSMDFSPVNPVAASDVDGGTESEGNIEKAMSQRRTVVGGELVSPAIDLVSAASQLGVLSDLKARIKCSPASDSLAERCRRTMMILTVIADGQFNAAEEQLAELHTRFVQMDRSQVTPGCPETLAILAGIQHAQTRDIAQELLSYIVEAFIRQERSESHDVWDRQMVALAAWARCQADAAKTADEEGRPVVLQNWIPVTCLGNAEI